MKSTDDKYPTVGLKFEPQYISFNVVFTEN